MSAGAHPADSKNMTEKMTPDKEAILIAEDDPLARRVLQSWLEK